MTFQPIDEMSLRHLFSPALAEENLRLSYIGPVLDVANAIQSSPDANVLDMRTSPFRPLRCEFKFIPTGPADFAHNGRFDIAIIWALTSGFTRQQLRQALLEQNGCAEIIVLSEQKVFTDLPTYSSESLSRLGSLDEVRKKALNTEDYGVCVLYIAAKIYPEKFNLDQMIEFLTRRFPQVKKMRAQGRASAVTAFVQTRPRLITRMHGKFYRWTSEFDSVMAASELSQLIIQNFGSTLPSKIDIESVK